MVSWLEFLSAQTAEFTKLILFLGATNLDAQMQLAFA